MNKAQLVSAVAEQAGITKKAAAASVDAFVSVVSDAIARGDKVTLVGFGSFYAVDRAARKGRNPKTGEEITIPASKAPKFKAGKALKESVR